jgi:phosphohistidine phosphatase
MRHAKSSWTEEGKTDFERSLNKRGRRVAPLMGEYVHSQGVVPDKIISSSAVRAQQTTELFVNSCAGVDTNDVRFVKYLYHAPASEYLDTLERFDDENAETLMLVGHNPGLENLIYQLSQSHETMPTATIARFGLGDVDWVALRNPFKATLLDVWRPKEIGIE